MIPHVISSSCSLTHLNSPYSPSDPNNLLFPQLPFLTSQVVTIDKDSAFHVFDTQSLHSEHTVYEEIFHSSTTQNKGDGYI